MTRRLYYDDSYRLDFSARLVECRRQDGGRWGLVLDETCFYPTSGGQLHDRGTLGGMSVVDVIDAQDHVLHVVEPGSESMPGPGDQLEGHIDGGRRAHHRQQHSGQHLLSRVLEERYGWPTLSSRLGETQNSLEIAAPDFPAELLEELEDRANDELWRSQPVRVHYLGEDEAADAGLRKKVERPGPVRVIEIGELDRCACGGTHVSNSAEIGVVVILGTEKMRGGTRIFFLCGSRAVQWRRERVAWLDQTARQLTTAHETVGETVARLQEEVRGSRKRLEALARELVRARVAEWLKGAEVAGSRRVVLRVLDPGEALAANEALHCAVEEQDVLAALLVPADDKVQVLMARGAAVETDCGALLRRALEAVGGKGGGRPDSARGGCTGVGAEAVLGAIRASLDSEADD